MGKILTTNWIAVPQNYSIGSSHKQKKGSVHRKYSVFIHTNNLELTNLVSCFSPDFEGIL